MTTRCHLGRFVLATVSGCDLVGDGAEVRCAAASRRVASRPSVRPSVHRRVASRLSVRPLVRPRVAPRRVTSVRPSVRRCRRTRACGGREGRNGATRDKQPLLPRAPPKRQPFLPAHSGGRGARASRLSRVRFVGAYVSMVMYIYLFTGARSFLMYGEIAEVGVPTTALGKVVVVIIGLWSLTLLAVPLLGIQARNAQ